MVRLPVFGAVGSLLSAAHVLAAPAPADFTANPKVGPGGNAFTDSPHFRIYGDVTAAVANATFKSLEAAYMCFVDDQGWRSTGLSFRKETDDGPFYKMNVYVVNSIPGASANTGTDHTLGFSYLNIVRNYMNEPAVTVHEFGHALTYHERYWVEQTRTGAWWETVANYVADTYLTAPVCDRARKQYGQKEGDTLIDLKKVVSDSFQVIVDGTKDTGNYYQAWPFLTYLVNNPDNYTGLGRTIFPDVWRKYKRNSNETPLHIISQLAAPTKIQTVVGRYWARIAYMDIGHVKAQQKFMSARSTLNFANLDSQGNGRYKVKAARQPRYMGSNIIPLKGTGAITATVTSSSPFTATLAIRAQSGAVRYLDLVNGTVQATLGNGEEASLVVVNTPNTLFLYDPFSISQEANRGLDYQVQLVGATV